MNDQRGIELRRLHRLRTPRNPASAVAAETPAVSDVPAVPELVYRGGARCGSLRSCSGAL